MPKKLSGEHFTSPRLAAWIYHVLASSSQPCCQVSLLLLVLASVCNDVFRSRADCLSLPFDSR